MDIKESEGRDEYPKGEYKIPGYVMERRPFGRDYRTAYLTNRVPNQIVSTSSL